MVVVVTAIYRPHSIVNPPNTVSVHNLNVEFLSLSPFQRLGIKFPFI